MLGCGLAQEASAGGFALREQGIHYQGMSFAGNAAGGASPASMFWNPATITQHPGISFEANGTVIWPQSEIEVDEALYPFLGLPVVGDANSGEIGGPAFVPSTYSVYQATERVFLGLSVNGPFGLATDAEDDYQGRFHGVYSDLRTYAATPTIAYQANEMVAVGFGLQIVYGEAELTGRTPVQFLPAGVVGPFPALVTADSELEGDDWGVGFTAGVTVTPSPDTTIGLGFRSAVDLNLEGEIEVDEYGLVLATPSGAREGGAVAQPRRRFDAQADVTLPEIVTLSLRHQVNEAFAATGTVEWTNWSRFDELRVRDRRGGTLTLGDQDWDDGWFFALGGEYAWSDRLTFRAGAAYEMSPVRDEVRTPRIPDADRVWLSLGASFEATDRLSFDVAYSHLFVEDGAIDRANANDIGRGDGARLRARAEDQSVDIFGVALRYKLGGEPIFIEPQPMVAPAVQPVESRIYFR